MTNETNRNSGWFKHLLGAGVLGIAILLGFVIGLRTGDRIGMSRLLRPVMDLSGAADSLAVVDTLAVPDTIHVQDSLAVEEPEAVAKFTKQQVAQGVEYLAAHNRWNRDEMEKIPALQGLWDAVNTYSLEEIRAYNETLASTPLTSIVEGLERKPKQGYYAAKNDHVITLSTYIKRLR